MAIIESVEPVRFEIFTRLPTRMVTRIQRGLIGPVNPPIKDSGPCAKTASWRLVTASPHLGASERTAASAGLGNMALKELQARLDALIKMPRNLPIIYLLEDTGAGKTCIVHQLLGTKNQSYPSVRRLRKT